MSEPEWKAWLAQPRKPFVHSKAEITQQWLEHCEKQLAANPSERAIWEPAINSATEFLDEYRRQYPNGYPEPGQEPRNLEKDING
jgi:hypothetical protein